MLQRIVAVGLAHLAAACLGEDPPTYNQAARQILHEKCANCHHDDGVGPMPLVTYAQTHAVRKAIATEVEAGRMPPWLPADGCNHYEYDLSLSANEKATLLAWVNGGAPEGPTPQTPFTEFVPPRSALPRVDLAVTMPSLYTLQPSTSEYDDFRCFLLDWPLDTTAYIRGLDVGAGDAKLVHHLLVYAVPADAVADFQALDDADPGTGWECYGGLGNNQADLVWGWQPGQTGGVIPSNIGRKIEPDSKLVLNMHYNLLRTDNRQDQTTLKFMLGSSGAFGVGVPIADPGWLLGEFQIEAGDPDAVFEFQYDPVSYVKALSPTPSLSLLLHGVSVHMHILGEKTKVEIIRNDGTRECLLDIPRWDFAWAGAYAFKRPVRLEEGDEVAIMCEFDDSAANQPYFEGEQIEPQDLVWDGIAPNEMCAGFLLATPGF